MGRITVAAAQMACGEDRDANLAQAETAVREAAGRGAQLVLLQELFETTYFCKEEDPAKFALAYPYEGNPVITRMSRLAATLSVVIPVSFFERSNTVFFNSMAMIDADGRVLGIYRKSHIPTSPGFQEKYYFTPGDTGFRVWQTQLGCLGVGICTDQWFPEAARAMALMGAELLLFPTAMGSVPSDPGPDSRMHWQRVTQGHAAANMLPIVAANRVGLEKGERTEVAFYGHSFITDGTGDMITQAETEPAIIMAELDLDKLAMRRARWGVFRDRRPDLYLSLLSLDGTQGNL